MSAPLDRVTANVLVEIGRERDRQIEVHHWTPEHDDKHTVAEWGWLLSKRTVELSCPVEMPDTRRLLVETAAIATAAIESYDRTHTHEGNAEHGPDDSSRAEGT